MKYLKFTNTFAIIKDKASLLYKKLKSSPLTVSPWVVVSFFSIVLFYLSMAGLLNATDDLYRHLKAYQYGYDYRNLFIHSHHEGYNPYIVFDYAASFLWQTIGPSSAFVFQVVPFLLTCIALIRIAKPHADNNTSAVIVFTTIYFTWDRYISGRPCIMVSSLFLLAYAYKDSWPRLLHVLFGCLMGSLYYLFFLYTIPLTFSKRTRLSYIIATCASAAAWMVYSKGRFVADIFSLVHTIDVKAFGIGYTELAPIISFAILSNISPFIPFIAFWKKDITRALMVAFFILLNKVRYLETAIPLACSFLQYINIRIPTVIVLALLTVSIKTIHPSPYPVVKLPPHSIVLATSSTTMNAVVAGSDYVQVVPSANVGWNDRDLLKGLALIATKGEFDCSMLDKYHFDYVVESRLNKIPACLELSNINNNLRIWRPKKNRR